jgi:hypothetical protein
LPNAWLGDVLSIVPTLPERRTGSISRNISMPRGQGPEGTGAL